MGEIYVAQKRRATDSEATILGKGRSGYGGLLRPGGQRQTPSDHVSLHALFTDDDKTWNINSMNHSILQTNKRPNNKCSSLLPSYK